LTAFVLDCSVAAAWFLDPASDPAVLPLLWEALAQGVLVPQLFPLEFANILALGERRGNATPDTIDRSLVDLAAIPIIIDDATTALATGPTVDLARRHRLTTYDAAYLELALRRRRPLATLDRELREAAMAESVAILPP
jgi:predicted nucleic acid-binding protein